MRETILFDAPNNIVSSAEHLCLSLKSPILHFQYICLISINLHFANRLKIQKNPSSRILVQGRALSSDSFDTLTN